jgi:hypothetical protein
MFQLPRHTMAYYVFLCYKTIQQRQANQWQIFVLFCYRCAYYRGRHCQTSQADRTVPCPGPNHVKTSKTALEMRLSNKSCCYRNMLANIYNGIKHLYQSCWENKMPSLASGYRKGLSNGVKSHGNSLVSVK